MARRLRIAGWGLGGAALLTAALAAAPTTLADTDDLSPISAADWNAERAAHLLERAGFGGTPEDIARLAAMTPQQAVDSLVDYETIDDTGLTPFDESGIWDPGMDPFPPSRAEAVRHGARARRRRSARRVLPPKDRSAGCSRSSTSSSTACAANTHRDAAARPLVGEPDARPPTRPLEEKLTLFWHGHFATGENKVRDYRMMLRQNADVPRATPSGTLRELLVGILKDPAMLVYLDNGENIKAAPERELRPRAARAVHDGRRQLLRARRSRGRARVYRLDERRADFKFDARSARLRRQDVSRPDRTARRRGHHRHDPRAAGRPASSWRRSSIGIFVRDDISAAGQERRSAATFRDERLSDEAAAEADLPLEGLLQPAVDRDADQESRACSWSRPTRSWACARCRRFRTSAA